MKRTLALDPHDPTPLYAQLERAIRAAIATGQLVPGEQLPTVRQLAVDLKVNANTVAKVYLELERTGAVETRRGVGTFVLPPGRGADGRKGRAAELRALARRCLALAHAQGFTAAELVEQLAAMEKGG